MVLRQFVPYIAIGLTAIIFFSGCSKTNNPYLGKWVQQDNSCNHLSVKEAADNAIVVELLKYYHGELTTELSYPGEVKDGFLEIYNSEAQKAKFLGGDSLVYAGKIFYKLDDKGLINSTALYLSAEDCNGNIGNGSINIDKNKIEFRHQDGPGWVEGNSLRFQGTLYKAGVNEYSVKCDSLFSLMIVEHAHTSEFLDYINYYCPENCDDTSVAKMKFLGNGYVEFHWFGKCLKSDQNLTKYHRIGGMENYLEPKRWLFSN